MFLFGGGSSFFLEGGVLSVAAFCLVYNHCVNKHFVYNLNFKICKIILVN